MDELKAEIEKIVGCNTEVTDITHDELCTQIYNLVQKQVKLFAIPDVSKRLFTIMYLTKKPSKPSR